MSTLYSKESKHIALRQQTKEVNYYNFKASPELMDTLIIRWSNADAKRTVHEQKNRNMKFGEPFPALKESEAVSRNDPSTQGNHSSPFDST
ncbi:unnamed protein product [Schistocephalus solidus]|uniref:Transposase n=1 Tax=Schistocephalus solidus TaxID=70667 RepID=A0A183SES2_SCHSO|nr:unnamed protein product [Schistocephalus solidus]